MNSTLFYCGSEESTGFNHQQIGDHDHFLKACFFCQKPLGFNLDIYMYRGNTAFCSNECRQEQIEKDTAMERRRVRRKTVSSESTASGSSGRSTVAGVVSVS